MPSKQETFNLVAGHLISQGKPSKDNHHCKYRTKEGLKCALGCLIPDEKYSPHFEGRALNNCPGLISLMSELGHDNALCEDLQVVHDQFPPVFWVHELYKVAKDHGLNTHSIEYIY